MIRRQRTNGLQVEERGVRTWLVEPTRGPRLGRLGGFQAGSGHRQLIERIPQSRSPLPIGHHQSRRGAVPSLQPEPARYCRSSRCAWRVGLVRGPSHGECQVRPRPHPCFAPPPRSAWGSWHGHEVFISIRGERRCLWRAVGRDRPGWRGAGYSRHAPQGHKSSRALPPQAAQGARQAAIPTGRRQAAPLRGGPSRARVVGYPSNRAARQ